MLEAEGQGHYERSACLAVFHGDLRAAVAALQVRVTWYIHTHGHI